MKKLIYILLLFLTVNTYAQVTVQDNTHYNLAEFTTNGCVLLGIKNIDITIEYIAPANEGYYNGYTFKDSTGTHIIRLAKTPDHPIGEVLCHELIHVKQMYFGKLIVLNDSILIYNSRMINLNKVMWLERPYEIDAIKESTTLYFRIIRMMKYFDKI